MTEPSDRWSDPAFLRDVQYRTDVNLAARQSIYSYQHPRIDLQARVLDLAAPAAGETVVDVGCGNGMYLAELARRGFAGTVIGADLSTGMLAAARDRLSAAACPGTFHGSDVMAEATDADVVAWSSASMAPATSGSCMRSSPPRAATTAGDRASA